MTTLLLITVPDENMKVKNVAGQDNERKIMGERWKQREREREGKRVEMTKCALSAHKRLQL